ncbi:hypothetical protein J3R82DRAFT_8291 [Butyriboletus roseoflavus]|nr:hypothetical protein J3R82DRAFT_8291 [Butyriboletus roseoflavus]
MYHIRTESYIGKEEEDKRMEGNDSEKDTEDVLAPEDPYVLNKCPMDECEDPLPKNLSPSLARLIMQGEKMIREDGTRDTSRFFKLSVDICRQVRDALQITDKIQRCEHWGWPMMIVWKDLPGRIVALKDKIHKLIFDTSARMQDPVHKLFILDIEDAGLGNDYTKLAKGQAVPFAIYRNARTGYYGRKGGAIIEATIIQMFGVSNPPGCTIAPLSFVCFMRYFLVPFVASHLITQDSHCSIQMACQMRQSSNQTGNVLHPLEDNGDEELKDILGSIKATVRKQLGTSSSSQA